MSKIKTKFLKPLTFNFLLNSRQIASLTAIAHSPTNSRILTLRKFKSLKEEFFGLWEVSHEPFYHSQSPQLIAQSSLLKAQSRNKKIRVNSRDTRKLICVFCDFARYFCIFVAWIGNQIKKGGNGKQKIYYNDLVF